jgi:hypothetical protein
MHKHIFNLFIIFSLVFLAFPTHAHAYLDPGSGSYLIQIVIASVAGAGLIIKSQWENIKNFINKKKVKTEKKNEEK